MNPCWPSQLRKFDFTTDEVADLWRIAKESYIDKGASFEDTISGMARDLGMNKAHIAQAFTEPKTLRYVNNDMWGKLQARREAISSARMVVDTIHDSAFLKKIEAAYNVPRQALVFGHGGVFPMTHMGQYLFIPSRWGTFFRTATNAWKFMSEKQYEIAIQRHLADPDYMTARRASKSVDPNQSTVGILGSMKGWGMRGFNSLKIARLSLFKREWAKLAPEDKVGRTGDTNAQEIMERIDHATGEVNLGRAGKYMAKVFFAPKLWPARIMNAIVDPAMAIDTVRKWKTASAGERQAAKMVMSHSAQVVASYAVLLAVNQGLNAFLGKKDKVNLSDPNKGDWLSFKIGGFTIRPPNPTIEIMRLAGGMLAAELMTPEKKLRGETPEKLAGAKLADYMRYKLHPTIRMAQEMATGTDLFGRPTPYKGIRQLLTGERPKTKKTPISWGEYALGKGPIPIGGAGREFYQLLREEGMSHFDAKEWVKILTTFAIEGEGMMAHSDYKK